MELLEIIKKQPIIPVFYHDDVKVCKRMLEVCYKGGVRLFEFVSRGEFAEENFKQLKTYRNTHFPEMKLGIGTIKTAQEANIFAELDTDFLVSPLLNEDIAEVAKENDILWVPGCMTPTEIGKAEQLHCQLIKIFPGNTVGPSFIKAMKSIYPSLHFMPTGGVELTQDNLSQWFKAGSIAVGTGSSLFKDVNAHQNIKENLKSGFSIINEAKRLYSDLNV